jgi:HEAT repeat protein
MILVFLYLGRERNGEPSYRGKSLSSWVSSYQGSHDIMAEAAIRAIGPKAVPFLFRTAHQPLGKETMDALHIIGPAAVRPLIALLKDPSSEIRTSAINALTGFATEFPFTTKLIVTNLANVITTDSSAEVRLDAALTLATLGCRSSSALAALIAALKQKDMSVDGQIQHVRAIAAYALGKIGTNAQAARPSLILLLDDGDWYTRHRAAEALWRISGDSNLIVQALTPLLKSTNALAREAATSTLLKIQEPTNSNPLEAVLP